MAEEKGKGKREEGGGEGRGGEVDKENEGKRGREKRDGEKKVHWLSFNTCYVSFRVHVCIIIPAKLWSLESAPLLLKGIANSQGRFHT